MPIDITNIIQGNFYQKQNKIQTNYSKKVLFLFETLTVTSLCLNNQCRSTYNHGSKSWFSWSTISWIKVKVVQHNATWTKFKSPMRCIQYSLV